MRLLRIDKNKLKPIVDNAISALLGKGSITLSLSNLLKIESPKDEDKPIINITKTAENKMKALVAQSSKEIAWHGTVTQLSPLEYRIDDIFVYPQKVTSTTVESDDDLYPIWLDELEDDVFNNIRMQGHSHVNMGVSPSSVDETYYEQLIQHIKDYYIFIIINKRGEIWANIYDIANNFVYEKNDIIIRTEGTDFVRWAKDQIDEYIFETKYNVGKVGGYLDRYYTYTGGVKY